MLSKLRTHVRSQFVGYIALFVALGGTAYAAVVVSSNSQVAQGTISGHKPPSGKHPNIIAGSINGNDVANNSGVETCTKGLARYGRICAMSDGGERLWVDALEYCAQKGLHLPSETEAITLARKFDVPGVDAEQGDNFAQAHFWSDDYWQDASNKLMSAVVGENGGGVGQFPETAEARTVCVADPSA